MIKTLIIDDEERARRVLRTMLQEYCDDVEIVAECDNIPDAVKQINELSPDLVFCDIEMPDHSGLELLSFFKDADFELIFATGYSEYALQAFEMSAIDYLLKPIQIEKLEAAVDKVRKKLEQRTDMNERLEILRSNLRDGIISKVALPVYDGLAFVAVNDILCVEADGSYSRIWLKSGEEMLISKKLKYFEALLKDRIEFYRVHRSGIININFLKKYSRNEGYVFLENDRSMRVSRERKAEFEEHINRFQL